MKTKKDIKMKKLINIFEELYRHYTSTDKNLILSQGFKIIRTPEKIAHSRGMGWGEGIHFVKDTEVNSFHLRDYGSNIIEINDEDFKIFRYIDLHMKKLSGELKQNHETRKYLIELEKKEGTFTDVRAFDDRQHVVARKELLHILIPMLGYDGVEEKARHYLIIYNIDKLNKIIKL